MVGLAHEANFHQDVKTRSKHNGEDVINNMSSLVKQNFLGRKFMKQTQRRGRNIWYGRLGRNTHDTYIRMIHTY